MLKKQQKCAGQRDDQHGSDRPGSQTFYNMGPVAVVETDAGQGQLEYPVIVSADLVFIVVCGQRLFDKKPCVNSEDQTEKLEHPEKAHCEADIPMVPWQEAEYQQQFQDCNGRTASEKKGMLFPILL